MLNREKSEELFNKISHIGNRISILKGVVQNPDFVTTENAKENYAFFKTHYNQNIKDLQAIQHEIFDLHAELVGRDVLGKIDLETEDLVDEEAMDYINNLKGR